MSSKFRMLCWENNGAVCSLELDFVIARINFFLQDNNLVYVLSRRGAL